MPEEIQPGREKVREEDVPASASRIAEPERDYSARLREIADSVEPLQYPVFAIDHNGVVIAWNHAIAALTGIRPEDITGCGAYAYAVPFYGSARPMLIDRILHPDKPFNPDLPPLTREGPTYIGEIEEVTIRGKHMLMKGMGTRIQDTRGSLIAAIQSLMVREQTPAHIAEADTTTEEYLGGVSSTVVKITGTGLLGTIAGAVGSTTGGYGVYATTKRLIVVHNPELDASRKNGIQFGSFIMDELFGSSVDVRIRSLDELENDKVFEVWRKDIASIDMKSPRLLAGYIIIRTKSGDSFRVFIDHKKAFIHLEELLSLSYPEILGSGQTYERGTTALSWVDLADALENVQYPIFAIDNNGVVIAWNRAIADLTGVSSGDIIGKGDHAYAIPFYNSVRPMLIDYIVMPADSTPPDPHSVTREGDTFFGPLESCTIRGRPVLIWSKGSAIYDDRGSVIAAVQSILVSDEQGHIAVGDDRPQEHYIGGISSSTVKVPGRSGTKTIAGAIGSSSGGFGVYATSQRLFVIRNPELDPSGEQGIQFGTFIIDELFGTTIDTRPREIAELEQLKIFEVARKNIISIEMKEPLLLAGYITFHIRDMEDFRVYIDHKNTFVHLDRLLRLNYPEIQYIP